MLTGISELSLNSANEISANGGFKAVRLQLKLIGKLVILDYTPALKSTTRCMSISTVVVFLTTIGSLRSLEIAVRSTDVVKYAKC